MSKLIKVAIQAGFEKLLCKNRTFLFGLRKKRVNVAAPDDTPITDRNYLLVR